jgi:hypothetical protein
MPAHLPDAQTDAGGNAAVEALEAVRVVDILERAVRDVVLRTEIARWTNALEDRQLGGALDIVRRRLGHALHLDADDLCAISFPSLTETLGGRRTSMGWLRETVSTKGQSGRDRSDALPAAESAADAACEYLVAGAELILFADAAHLAQVLLGEARKAHAVVGQPKSSGAI